MPGRCPVGGHDVVDAPVHERARAPDPAYKQPVLKFAQRRPCDGPAHREARGDLVLAGDACSGPASREVVDERVDDLGVLTFAHVTHHDARSCPDNLPLVNGPASQGKHQDQLSLHRPRPPRRPTPHRPTPPPHPAPTAQAQPPPAPPQRARRTSTGVARHATCCAESSRAVRLPADNGSLRGPGYSQRSTMTSTGRAAGAGISTVRPWPLTTRPGRHTALFPHHGLLGTGAPVARGQDGP